MAQTEELLCLFSAEIRERGGESVIEIPTQEIEMGTVEPGATYRVGLFSGQTPDSNAEPSATGRSGQPTHLSDRQREPPADEPPVQEGDVLQVQIEDMGDQGDGIARVGPGFIVFVPDTEIGDRVSVEITTVKDTVAFGEVKDRLD